jgi:hypothetical protein
MSRPHAGHFLGAPLPASQARVDVGLWQIVLQKSPNAVQQIYRQKTKQAAIAD